MIAATIVLNFAGLIALWLLSERKRIQSLEHYLETARAQTSVQIARRHEITANLLDLLEAPLADERETLAALLSARLAAAAALEAGPASAASTEAEAQLNALLRSVIAFVGERPDLAGVTDLRALRDELRSTENRIAFARQLYHDAACFYNAGCASFSARLLARGARPAEMWKTPELPADQAQPAALPA